ncbi:hypothetical protein E24_00394 [Faustovirus]|nr:hypothetical protein PRJ_Fausto_00371 [Faustovirus]AMN83310.1 hypothetical protein E24_00394 [Faustovirus]AMN84293.1 hypothetical protein D5a_00393 [Faustovirus]AMN85281.1 hypothetical protein E23_00394 [Faustovirus]QBR99278.1 hypothetical protein [Faustovirus mariensis]
MEVKPNKYTVIEEYVPISAGEDKNHIELDKLPAIDSVYHSNNPLSNPILNDSNTEDEELKDLFGDPIVPKCDKMDTEMSTQTPTHTGIVLALPNDTNVAATATPATKQPIPEFSKEYKDSLQANAENTADIKLDNIELPNAEDKELKTFLDEMDKKAKAATGATSSYYSGGTYNYTSGYSSYSNYGGYGGYSGYKGYSEYDGYKSRYSSPGYNYNNYDSYSSYNRRNRDDDWYADKKAKIEDVGVKDTKDTDSVKVKFSDEAEVAQNDTSNTNDLEASGMDIDIKDLNELKKLMVTKFSTTVKLFTRTLSMINNVKTMQNELKKMQASLIHDVNIIKREMTVMGSQMDYVTKTVRYIKDQQTADDDDDSRSNYYGINYSDDDDGYVSPDDITKKPKFDNTIPELR